MPTYVYRRQDGTEFEVQQSIHEDPLETCPDTEQPVERVIQPVSVRFSGTGFYGTDYGGDNPSV